ncbi:MAG: FAD-dependent oxidoreductase [Chitinophagales bacterium]
MEQFPFSEISTWLSEPKDLCPSLQSDIRTDVVIVGGGYTGLYTAIGLREAGINVVVLEQDFVGAGGSGRNSGYVDGLIGKDYPSLLKIYKKERARELCNFAKEGVLKVEDFIKKHKIPCDYEPNGNIMAAVHPKQIKKLKTVVAAGEGLGLDFTFLSQEEMEERGMPQAFIAGLFDPVGGFLNPGLLVSHLRRIALEKGVQLYEKTAVLELRDSSPVVARCKGGTVTADQAVLATNVYTHALGWKKRLMSPVCAGMFETEPLSDEQMAAIGGWEGREGIYTAHEQLENYRLTANNSLIVGGKHIKIPFGNHLTNTYIPEVFTAIEGMFRERFPELVGLKVKTFWGGWIGIAMDFMPDLGKVGKHQNIHYGLGFSGHGIPHTCLMGELLTEQIQGKEHPLAKVLKRRVLPVPPEPFKWLGTKAISGILSGIDGVTDKQVRKMNRTSIH